MGTASASRLEYIGGDRFHLIRDATRPCPERGEALIRVHLCGICGSDLSYTRAVAHTAETAIVLGHEMVGEVVELAGPSEGVAVGDLVVANPGVECGRCEWCKRGLVNICPNSRFAGYGTRDGFLRDYAAYPVSHLHRTTSAPLVAVLAEPMAVCVHALRIAKPRLGMTALVAGCGGIGALLVFLLKRSGFGVVVATDPIESRRQLALAMGADLALDPSTKHVDELQEELRVVGIGAVDRYFEASGATMAIRDATRLTAPGGTVIVVGIPDDDQFAISNAEARKKELTFIMSRTICHDFPTAIRLLESNPEVGQVVGAVWTVEELANRGLAECRRREIPGRTVVALAPSPTEML